MPSPVAPSVIPPPSVSGTAGDAGAVAGGAASGANVVVDFAALLLAQVDVQEMQTADPAIAAAAKSDAAPEDSDQAPASGASDLASLLNAIVPPPANPAAMPAVAKRTEIPAATAAVQSAGQLSAALAAPGVAIEPGETRNDLLQGTGSARQSSTIPAEGVAIRPGAEVGTANFADPEIKLAAANTSSSEGRTPLAPALTNVPTPAHHANPTNSSAPATVRLDTPIDNARWSTDFGQRIVWLARQDVQVAQLTINPPNLGPVDVHLNLGGDQAAAVFTSPHADVREAIEAALPRLREMLAGAGISLGQTQVNSQSQQQPGNQGHNGPDRSPGFAGGPILSGSTDVNLSHMAGLRRGVGLVDTFA